MAGFLLWHNSELLDVDYAKKAFNQLNYKAPYFFNILDWNILIFPKSRYAIKNYFQKDGILICAVGTFGYKGLVYEQSLPIILDDFNKDLIDEKAFWGSYTILIVSDKITLLRDKSGLSRLYAFQDKIIFSSSFAGMVEVYRAPLSLDIIAIQELLLTGVITKNQTIIKEIHSVSELNTPQKIEVKYIQPEKHQNPKTYKEALIQQINILNNYNKTVVKDWEKYNPASLFDIGMTSGMDSRLNIIGISKHSEKLVLHTHWRKEQNKDKDFKYANLFSKMSGIPINIKKVMVPLDMTEEQLENNFKESYNLCDGVIRGGCYWDEEYNTEGYRSGLESKHHLRLLGFGGEQYRNRERIPLKSKVSIDTWIKWIMIYQFAGGHLNSDSERDKLIKHIKNNIFEMFGTNQFNLNLENFKKYIRAVESPSYRSIQASMENRIGFCINPFLDSNVSFASQLAVPFLGKSLSFQLDMMNNLSEKLSMFPNGYGYDFTKGEPLSQRIISQMWQLFPFPIKYPLYAKKNNYFFVDYIELMIKRSPLITEQIEAVKALNLPIDIEKHTKVRSRSRLVLNLGYFLLRNNSKITK